MENGSLQTFLNESKKQYVFTRSIYLVEVLCISKVTPQYPTINYYEKAHFLSHYDYDFWNKHELRLCPKKYQRT